MSTTIAIALGIGLAAATGFRVFVPFLIACIAHKMGLLPLKEGFMWLGSWPAFVMFLTAAIVEVGAYYIPVLDHLLDVIAAPLATVAGILLTVSVLPPDLASSATWAIGIIGGGGAAFATQLGTTAIRGGVSILSGAGLNWLFSTLELIGSILLSILSIVLPVLVAVAIAVVLVIAIPIVIVVGIFLFLRRNKQSIATSKNLTKAN
jgi:hypothetical protein